MCYDNGAYMNTGFQRSSATPHGAWTATSPVGEELPGKLGHRKNLTEIMVAHRLPYVAQSSPHDPQDPIHKASKALEIEGPTFLNVLSACPTRLARRQRWTDPLPSRRRLPPRLDASELPGQRLFGDLGVVSRLGA